MRKVTVPELRNRKRSNEKIIMVTAYDATTAGILDEASVDVVLVGDSVANVVQGRTNTLGVTIDEMVYHTKIVARGVKRALLTADMPFMSYQVSKEEAIRNAGRLVKEANAEAVKLEVNEHYLETVCAIYKAGIPVMGHIGLCPQSIHVMGGYRVQGRGEAESARLLKLAKEIEERGAFAIVLESIPSRLAEQITVSIDIPTIGIGAGPHCDGQVMVINDLIGLTEEPLPRFVKRYANVRETLLRSVNEFSKEVREGSFPAPEHCYD